MSLCDDDLCGALLLLIRHYTSSQLVRVNFPSAPYNYTWGETGASVCANWNTYLVCSFTHSGPFSCLYVCTCLTIAAVVIVLLLEQPPAATLLLLFYCIGNRHFTHAGVFTTKRNHNYCSLYFCSKMTISEIIQKYMKKKQTKDWFGRLNSIRSGWRWSYCYNRGHYAQYATDNENNSLIFVIWFFHLHYAVMSIFEQLPADRS